MMEKEVPSTTMPEKELPNTETATKELPTTKTKRKALPKTGDPENTVMIGDRLIEIKPTLLKYMRNHTAVFYKMFDIYPLTDILAMDSTAFGDGRDGDKAVMDWLIAVTNDEQLIVENYDTMDAETIEKMLTIFRRVNHIDEKEEKRKNLETAGKVV